jgi:hypothetical protein
MGVRPRGEEEKRENRKVRRELEVRAGGGCGWGSREAEAKKVIVRSWLPLSIVILGDGHGQRFPGKRKEGRRGRWPMARAAVGDAESGSRDRSKRERCREEKESKSSKGSRSEWLWLWL